MTDDTRLRQYELYDANSESRLVTWLDHFSYWAEVGQPPLPLPAPPEGPK